MDNFFKDRKQNNEAMDIIQTNNENIGKDDNINDYL